MAIKCAGSVCVSAPSAPSCSPIAVLDRMLELRRLRVLLCFRWKYNFIVVYCDLLYEKWKISRSLRKIPVTFSVSVQGHGNETHLKFEWILMADNRMAYLLLQRRLSITVKSDESRMLIVRSIRNGHSPGQHHRPNILIEFIYLFVEFVIQRQGKQMNADFKQNRLASQ